MRRTLNSTGIITLTIIAFATIVSVAMTVQSRNFKSAQQDAFNEGRLRQCTYTFGCDMKSLKAELFDQRRKLEKGVDKPSR